jgi:hypothetical protein
MLQRPNVAARRCTSQILASCDGCIVPTKRSARPVGAVRALPKLSFGTKKVATSRTDLRPQAPHLYLPLTQKTLGGLAAPQTHD